MTTLPFTIRDWLTFGALFLTSCVYAAFLHVWWKKYPQSYEALTWFQVWIGDGYVLLALLFVLPLEQWLRVAAAFFFASLAITGRSIFVHSANQREAEDVIDHKREA